MNESKTRAADVADEVVRLREDLGALKGDIARLVKSMRSDAGEMGEEAQQLYAKLAKNSERSARAIVQELEDRPLTTLLVAFAVGFIGGRGPHLRVVHGRPPVDDSSILASGQEIRAAEGCGAPRGRR